MSVYKIIEVVGTSTDARQKAAQDAIETTPKSLKDLRITEVVKLDIQMDDGKVKAYRAKLKVSFKYHS